MLSRNWKEEICKACGKYLAFPTFSALLYLKIVFLISCDIFVPKPENVCTSFCLLLKWSGMTAHLLSSASPEEKDQRGCWEPAIGPSAVTLLWVQCFLSSQMKLRKSDSKLKIESSGHFRTKVVICFFLVSVRDIADLFVQKIHNIVVSLSGTRSTFLSLVYLKRRSLPDHWFVCLLSSSLVASLFCWLLRVWKCSKHSQHFRQISAIHEEEGEKNCWTD